MLPNVAAAMLIAAAAARAKTRKTDIDLEPFFGALVAKMIPCAHAKRRQQNAFSTIKRAKSASRVQLSLLEYFEGHALFSGTRKGHFAFAKDTSNTLETYGSRLRKISAPVLGRRPRLGVAHMLVAVVSRLATRYRTGFRVSQIAPRARYL